MATNQICATYVGSNRPLQGYSALVMGSPPHHRWHIPATVLVQFDRAPLGFSNLDYGWHEWAMADWRVRPGFVELVEEA